jgi:hypothetical protein
LDYKTKKTKPKIPHAKRHSTKPQPINPAAIYSRRAAAQVLGRHEITLLRAYRAGHLKAYLQGRYVTHSGQHLIDWLESGGKTGWKEAVVA